MKVLVLEDNLLWSSRVSKTLRSLGHEVEVVTALPDSPTAELAIVNLSSPELFEAVALLRASGIPVLGHAGHKEKELWQKGREAGCYRIVSNSEMTFKLPDIIKELEGAR